MLKVSNITNLNRGKLKQLLEVERASWDTELEATLDLMEKRYEIHPKGYWIGMENQRIVSFVYFIRLKEKGLEEKKGWDEITSYGSCKEHDEKGEVLFGVTLSSSKADAGNLLMKEVLKIIDQGFYIGVKKVYACCRIPSLIEKKELVVEKDPTVKLFKQHNFEIVKLEKDGYKKDVSSMGYSLLMRRDVKEQFILKRFNEISSEEFLFQKFKFRELHIDYLNVLNALDENNFNFLLYNESILIPFLDKSDSCLKGKNFDFLYKLYPKANGKKIFFLDHLNVNEFIRIVKKLQESFKNQIYMCNELQKRTINNGSKLISYNTYLLLNEKDIEEKYIKWTSKIRREFQRWERNFKKVESLEIKKIDLTDKEVVQEMRCLYNRFSKKFENYLENDRFWEMIKFKKKVEFYGIFYFNKLICFSGLWNFKSHNLFSMIGKDEKYENILKKSNSYFIFNLYASKVSKGKEKVYYGYGNYNLKKQLLMKVENLYINYL